VASNNAHFHWHCTIHTANIRGSTVHQNVPAGHRHNGTHCPYIDTVIVDSSATAAGQWRDAVTIDAQTSSQTDIQYSKIRSVSEIYTATGKYRSLYQFYMSPEAMDTSGYISSIFCKIWDRSKLFLTNYRPKTESAGAVRKCAFSFKLFRPLHKSYTAVTKTYLSKR